VVLMATIEACGRQNRVRVGNVSPHGALIAGDTLPMEDEQVVFSCNSCTVHGRVAWVEGSVAGIQFDNEVSLDELLRALSQHSHVVIKDTRTVDFRRPGFRGNQLTDEERRAVENWIGRPRTSR
jgi:hypothetical protein